MMLKHLYSNILISPKLTVFATKCGGATLLLNYSVGVKVKVYFIVLNYIHGWLNRIPIHLYTYIVYRL